METKKHPLFVTLTAVLAVAAATTGQTRTATRPGSALRVAVVYDEDVTDSFTGRVYLMLGRGGRREPRFGPAWFNTQPFFALDVEAWKPGETLLFDDRALGYPGPLSELDPGDYRVQAVMRMNLDSNTIGSGPGSAYSTVADLSVGGDHDPEPPVIMISDVVELRPEADDTERIKTIAMRSDLLSDFYGRDIVMRATVILPLGYDDDPDRRYPTYYWIGGFGSTHRVGRRMRRRFDESGFGDRIVRVVPDPSCYGGHHVFADSANNGPRGTALVEEFIPHLEKTYRLVAEPAARFLGGHSSGGWASLWLQVAYPDFFGGVWSVAPDPVDFTDFQQIDLYTANQNTYVDAVGKRRPVGRRGTTPFIWYDDFSAMELVMGEGGQLRSFDWVFSPRAADGLPRRLYDPHTGVVDPEVARAWERYDIRLVLERNWETLGPKLKGKLNIITGELDTFYLEGAVENLKKVLERLGSDAVVEIVPGADHGSVSNPSLLHRIDKEMIEAFVHNSS